jgi:ATP-dependent Lhr-like helicase
MTNLPPSSTSDDLSSAFDRLHPDVQQWIYDQQWTELRVVQAKAINAVLSGTGDIILAAATAAGKTEAAFLPILSLMTGAPATSCQVMYVGPLKALINDQFFRLELLCEQLNVPVAKWHGDVPASMKRRARERPSGVLLITPESLEAIFDRHPELIPRMFGALGFVVIDELHTFLSTERGLQLASLLKRLDMHLKCPPRRVGLSATIGDMALAAGWLRPANPGAVTIIEDRASGAGLQLQIRGVVAPIRPEGEGQDQDTPELSADERQALALRRTSHHLFKVMRSNANHLVFASSRRDVEQLADMLREQSARSGVANQFFPHHGNLSRDMREVLERRLKDGQEPTTAIATSTLELGVDIGAVESVAQIGVPRSISSLRQRVGRSGRRKGKPAILRLYAEEEELTAGSSLTERLRIETVQSIAAVRLMLEGWVEPPMSLTQNLSTLLHQILALIVERGGVDRAGLMQCLGGPGPFENITVTTIRELLKGMKATEPPLLEEAPDGTLMLGELGETITSSYEFFAVFSTPDEFRIVAKGRTLGTVSIVNAFGPDDYIVFAGQRWKVVSVDDRARVVQVEGAPAGRAPNFGGGEPAALHDRFAFEIRAVFLDPEIPAYLDSIASQHLGEAQKTFREVGLGQHSVIVEGGWIYLFPWRGTATLDTLRLALKRAGLIADQSAVSLSVPAEKQGELRAALADIANSLEIDGMALAEFDENLERSKYDSLIPRFLLQQAAAIDRLSTATLPDVAEGLRADLSRV